MKECVAVGIPARVVMYMVLVMRIDSSYEEVAVFVKRFV